MLALVPVRDGVLPSGADEAIAECGGRVVIAGSGTADVAVDGIATEVVLVELGDLEPARWAHRLQSVFAGIDDNDVLVLPNSPDGRDLAPRMAVALDRPLLAGATEISTHRVRVARRGGLELHEQRPAGPFVATLQPGVRGADHVDTAPAVRVHDIAAEHDDRSPVAADRPLDAHVVEVIGPDVQTMDLAEADRIVGGGAGLDSEQRFDRLDRFAASIGGVMGATRVITDRAWVHHDRQIGTTGVVVDPTLYLSFGVSGAVQHTAGLGHPDHVVSVNTDPHCPMMAMSDLAVVSDANVTLDELLALLSADDGEMAS